MALSFPSLVLLLGLLVGLAPVSRAQQGGLVDYATIGIGLGMYQGELDRNPSDNPIEFLSLGDVNLLVAVDKKTGFLVNELALSYQRTQVDIPEAEMQINLASLDLTTGARIAALGRPGFIRIFAGVGAGLIATSYDRVCERPGDAGCTSNAGATLVRINRSFEQQGTRFALSFPMGIIFQDAVRLGIRVMTTDQFDSTTRSESGPDVISYINLGYHFTL